MSFLAVLVLTTSALAADGVPSIDPSTPFVARVATVQAPTVAPPARLHQASVAGQTVRLDAARVTLHPGEGAELTGALLRLVWTGEADAVTVLAGATLLPEVGAGMYVLPVEPPRELEIIAWRDDRPTDIRIVRID
jgi:hypothetical protein